jgi:predicted metal-dependent phosphoesterase TrpH
VHDRVRLRADLHTHSTASDGSTAPADLIRQAFERGLSILALTDHDTTLGIPEAVEAGERLGVRVIPGIELSTDVERGEIHLLGYAIDPTSADLQETLARLRDARQSRLTRILQRLQQLGYPVPETRVRPATDDASTGRAHVARAMVAAGYVESVDEAFERFLGSGRPAYVASERLSPEAAVRLVQRAGGLPVLAHPFSYPGFESRLPALIEAGLEGLEVYYGEYDTVRRGRLAAIARQHGLLSTGGSDYHGAGFREGRDLGSVELPPAVVARFLERVDRAAPG